MSPFIQVILPLRIDWEPYYELEGAAVGDRVNVAFARKTYVGVVSAVGVCPESSVRVLPAEKTDLPPFSPEDIAFWRAIADYYLCTPGEVYKAACPSVLRQGKPRTRKSTRPAGSAPAAGVVLSEAQKNAMEAVQKAFSAQKTVLLHGVTGSGKTELYLELARRVLASGKSVLYLVPEIALSRQLEERIGAVFPDLFVYHSAQSIGRRRSIAAAVRTEDATFVLGTRSALFLPHRKLGLIIVDEEHDASYKQDQPAPRYHAREAAILLAGIQGASVVLGSATPSLESLYNTQTGLFAKVDLKERFHKGDDARILLIDTIAERKKKGMVGHFSLKLLEEIRRTLDAGGQAVLLRSRRAYAPAVQCSECGKIPKCPHCNVSLSLHKEPERLACHYCGHTESFSGRCPSCGGPLQPIGAGTQKIEEELREIFPDARIGLLDSDHADEETVRKFSAGDLDILVGTQLLTKGFDFDKLSLAAVIQADNILSQQSFRADERALQLLEQFRGRSGRRDRQGLFVIQTREPGHPVFEAFGEDRSALFLAERQAFGYPPYTRLIHLVLKDKNEKRLDYLSALLAQNLSFLPAVIGPYAPMPDCIADRHIRHIRIMLPRDRFLKQRKQELLAAVNAFERDRKYAGHIAIDVDPV